MKLTPRHEPTTLAGIELSTAVCEIAKKHELTYPELVSLLAREIALWTKWQVRDERESGFCSVWQEAADLMGDYDLLSTSGQSAFYNELVKRASE